MDPSLRRNLYHFTRPIVPMSKQGEKTLKISNMTSEKYVDIKMEILYLFMKNNIVSRGFEIDIINHPIDQDIFDSMTFIISIDRRQNLNRTSKHKSFRDFLYNISCFKNIETSGDQINCLFKFNEEYYEIIFIKANSSRSAVLYYSNGIGELVYILSNYLGFTFNKNGLYLNIDGNMMRMLGLNQETYRNATYAKILLTEDDEEIISILGLNSHLYSKNLISKYDLNDWIKSSQYYDDEIFKGLRIDSENSKIIGEIKLLDYEQRVSIYIYIFDILDNCLELNELLNKIKYSNNNNIKIFPINYNISSS